MKEIFVDVLVVGAGIAGTVAALKIAKDGRSVLVIEKLNKIGSHNNEKIDITENLELDDIFYELDLPHIGKFNKSVWHSPSCTFTLHSNVHDYYILRGPGKKSFESIVSLKASRLGAKFWTDAEIVDIYGKNGFFSKVKVRKGSNHVLVNTRFIIGAVGINFKIFEKFGFLFLESKGVDLVGYGGVFTDINIPSGETHIFFDSILAPGGYFYLGRTNNNFCVASIVIDKAKQSNKSLKYFFERFKEENYELKSILNGSKIQNTFVGIGKAGIIKKRVIGNVALVGDAGLVMDPIFGYGVRQAIISGYLSASIIADNIDNPHCLEIYEHELKYRLLKNERESHFLRSIMNKMDNKTFDSLFRVLIDINKLHKIDSLLSDKVKLVVVFLKVFLKRPIDVIRLVAMAIF
ncbi:MAG: NAD(P)/FAD-dependent oxidoreductase [Candidatus Diapherotrites archaeon]